MSNTNSEDSVIIGILRDLRRDIDNVKKEVISTTEDTIKELNDNFVALRQDMHDTTSKIHIKLAQHDDQHHLIETAKENDRFLNEQAKEHDKLMRDHRQFTLNLWLGGITVLAIIVLLVEIISLLLRFYYAK